MITEEIEWNLTNASAISGEENYLKGDFIDEPPLFITTNIRFSDNRWDISSKLHPEAHPLDFSHIQSKVFRVLLKMIILRELFSSRKRKRNVTVYDKTFNPLKRFILYLEQEKYMYSLRYLTPEIIEEYIDSLKKLNNTRDYFSRQLFQIKKFLQEVQLAGHQIDLTEYQKMLHVPYEERKAELLNNKTPNIPKRIFYQIIKCALRDMENDSLRIQDRMMACLIVILSYTGMRKGELERLEIDKLRDITILDKKEKAYYLEFFTYKTTPSKDGRWTKTIAWPNTVKAYQMYEMLSKERRARGKSTYLYLNRSGKRYATSSFDYHFDTFFYRNQKELFHNLSDYEIAVQVQTQKVTSYSVNYFEKDNSPIIGETFLTLNAHQFRVAIANILKDKVDLQWIRQHMNHLSEEMTKHYFRDDDILMKETLIRRARVDGNSLELEPNNQKSFIKNELSEPELLKAYEAINKFLKKKKYNIFKDIDDIINTLKYNPLRENIVGVCTRHLGQLCERQYRLATFEKWYYFSPKVPNIESFDFTYKRFIDKAKIVQHNKDLVQQDSKYQRDYENEYSALIKFYQNRVLPEQDLLLSISDEEGKEFILFSYPQLESIISNIDEVNKEIEKWASALILNTV